VGEGVYYGADSMWEGGGGTKIVIQIRVNEFQALQMQSWVNYSKTAKIVESKVK